MAAAAILAGLVAIVYGRAVGAGFVFDDHALVVENPLVRESPARIGGLFLHSPERAGFAYRPVRVLSYQVAEPVRAGKLATVLSEFEPPRSPVSLVTNGQGLLPQKLRAFLDFAAPLLRASLECCEL